MNMRRKILNMFLLAIPLVAFFSLTGFTGDNSCPVKVLANYDPKLEESETETKTDTTKPTVEAAISEEKLNIQAYDYESGIKSIYVNNYEYPNVKDGKLIIRLQQFDSGYECFKIRALDNAGNLSDEYKVENPYFENGEQNKTELHENVEPTNPTDATATVKDYVSVEGDNSVRMFYTIETKTGKKFYLIIDRTDKDENVHFLTEISERDLLNTTSDNAQTLPKNSAALFSGQPIQSAAIPEKERKEEGTEQESETEAETEIHIVEKDKKKPSEDKPLGTLIVLGIAGIIGYMTYNYIKSKKKEDYQDEEDDSDNEDDLMINEDEEERLRKKENEFFDYN